MSVLQNIFRHIVKGFRLLAPFPITGEGLGLGVVVFSLLSCSDFSSYNSVVESSNPSADRTLWENISAKGELSDFAQILQAVGYDAVLNAPTTYTVWAPVNGTFNKDSIMALTQDAATRKKVIEQFVYDHVAH